MTQAPTDTISIHGLEVDCIVGLRPEERVSVQRLCVDIALGLDTREAGRTGRIGATLDYNRIARDVVALLEFRRYRLVEVAAEELSLALLSSHPAAEWVKLRLEKPGALAGRARAASVEVTRTRADLGAVSTGPSTALRTSGAELVVLELDGGQSLPETERGTRVIDRLLSGQLYADDGTVWVAGLPCPDKGLGRWRANGSLVRVLRCTVRTGG
jgi:dihydroneopterin aldolase